MILVDTSVWIPYLNGHKTVHTAKLEAAVRQPILIGDLILLELLQGARDDLHAARMERYLRQYTAVSLLDDRLAAIGAQNYRRLRSLGITIRKSADIVIGTFCIEYEHTLLHDDRDFVPMETHLGLKVL